MGKKESFWPLWQAIADRIVGAQWVQYLAAGRSGGMQALRHIFLGLHWKDDIRTWHSLDGYADRVDSLYERLPPSSAVLEAYLYYRSFRVSDNQFFGFPSAAQ